MMKKILLSLLMALIFILTACSSRNENEDDYSYPTPEEEYTVQAQPPAGHIGGGPFVPVAVTEIPPVRYQSPAMRRVLAREGEIPYRVWFDRPAPNRFPNTPNNPGVHSRDTDWEFFSLPIGNGFHGASLFGRTDTERISFSESTLFNQAPAGLTAFLTFYMDFGHDFAEVTNYFRELLLNEAVATVQYTYNGITFIREHIASHPDGVTAIRMTAVDGDGNAVTGALNVTLRPVIPFVRPEGFYFAGARGKSATVLADENTNTIRLFGQMENFGINYEAQVRVVPTGNATVRRYDWRFDPNRTTSRGDTGFEGAEREPNIYSGEVRGRGEAYDAQGLRVENADELLILVALGTNYRLYDADWRENVWPTIFTSAAAGEGWGFPGNADRLDRGHFPEARVRYLIEQAAARPWDELLGRHLLDYQYFFDRARLHLGGTALDAFTLTTEARVGRYRQPGYMTFDPYHEVLFWQFGRYLLISSSREHTLPAHLQGIWTAYELSPWSGAWWHNINLKMNYWPAFNTNLADLFQSYADFSAAFRPAAQRNADNYLLGVGAAPMPGQNPRMYGPVGRNVAPAGLGRNGWIVGTGVWPYHVSSPDFTTHSGPGTGGMTTSLFWEYWAFTYDLEILANTTWPAVEGMAQFLMRTLRWCEIEELYLVWFSASPELLWRPPYGGSRTYYRTIGTLFDQQMVADVYHTTIQAARILQAALDDPGVDLALNHPIDWDFINQITRESEYLKPVIVGLSGQVKEFREELFYGEITDEWDHRHLSHLLGLFPGTVINSNTPHWMDAVRTTLNYRGDFETGWSRSHKLNLWARLGDGDRAYTLLRSLLRGFVRYNMWGQHEPFQIDANFGGISGMSEMLVQSHEGYISLLPARPTTWASGSFRGLTARGGFEVDAVWEDQQAREFTIHSNKGGVVYVVFYNIANAGLVTRSSAQGDTMFAGEVRGADALMNPDGTVKFPGVYPSDIIRLETQAGESFTLSQIPPFTPTLPPIGPITFPQVPGAYAQPGRLLLETGRFDGEAGVRIRWDVHPEQHVTFNIYAAKNSEPDYQLITSGVTETSFIHRVNPDETQGHQFTYRVTAVAADGRASRGVTGLLIPPRPPVDATGLFGGTDNTTLTITITPETRQPVGASSRGTPTEIPVPRYFQLFEQVNGNYVLRATGEENTTTLTAENANTSSDAIFYVQGYDPVTGTSEKVRVSEVIHPTRTSLETTVTAAEARISGNYTATSWQIFAARLNNAQQILSTYGNPQIYQETLESLKAAVNALEEDPFGMARTALQYAITDAQAVPPERYTLASRRPMFDALANAQALLTDTTAEIPALNQARTQLQTTRNNLIRHTPAFDPAEPLHLLNSDATSGININIVGAYFNNVNQNATVTFENINLYGGISGFNMGFNMMGATRSNVSMDLIFTRAGLDEPITIPLRGLTWDITADNWDDANAATTTLAETIPIENPDRFEGEGWHLTITLHSWNGGGGMNIRYFELQRVNLVWPE